MSNILKKPIIFVLLVFIILTAVFTFPLILHTSSYIPGFSSSDEPYGALWYFWWMNHAHTNHFNLSRIHVIAAPFGQFNELGYVYWNFLNKVLIFTKGPIFAYNIQILFSFILSGFITYILAFYVLKNKLAALFSALAFTFCPYHFVRSWQHLGLSQVQWMPLYMLSILKLRENKSLRNTLIAALSFALVAAFDLYYAYFMFIVTVVFIIYDYLYARVAKDSFALFKFFIGAGIFIAIIELPDIYYIAKGISRLSKIEAGFGPYGIIRPFGDLFAQSAKPLSYLLPSVTHPLFGLVTEQFIGTQAYGDSLTEHTLYLGWVPLTLAIVAIKNYKKNIYLTGKGFYFGFFILLGLSSWLFSQPPWWNIFGFKLYMPSFFMYKIAPMFRAYCRFGIVVMLAVAVLAGFGLKLLLLKYKSRYTKIALTCLFSGLVLFEFWNWPPYKVIDVSVFPEAYTWLKSQPGDFTIAEYPLDTNGMNEMYKFYQTKHGKRIINGTIPGTYANKIAKGVSKLTAPGTAGILKWMGVKYVFVHRGDYLNSELTEDSQELSKIPANPGLKFVKSFPAQDCPDSKIMCVRKSGQIDAYEVIAPAIKPE